MTGVVRFAQSLLDSRRFRRNVRLAERDRTQQVSHPVGSLGKTVACWKGCYLPYKDWPINHEKTHR